MKTTRLLILIFYFSILSLNVNANPMDIILGRFVQRDNSGNIQFEGGNPIPDQESYESLGMDLAFAIAPKLLSPAETLGYSGFFIGLEGTLTIIDSGAYYWQEGIERQGSPQDILFVPSLHIRKGLPFSFEIGTSISYITDSEMVIFGGDISFAPFEGYRTGVLGYFPDIKFRFTGSYLTGEDELALGLLGADVSISYSFTISGQVSITPYAGYQYMWVGLDHEIVLASEYIENPTSYVDKYGASASEYVDFEPRNFGSDGGPLSLQRIFIGSRFMWESLAITPEFAFSLENQFQVSLSIGGDF